MGELIRQRSAGSTRDEFERSKHFKKFFEEAVPTHYFIESARPDVDSVQLSDNTTPFDATIRLSDGSESKIEITWAKDGHEEDWQLKYMRERGSVFLTYDGDVNSIKAALKSGSEIVPAARERIDGIKKIADLAIKAIERKQAMDYPNTILLVPFADLVDDQGEDVAKLIEEHFREASLQFVSVYLVNFLGRSVREIHFPKSI